MSVFIEAKLAPSELLLLDGSCRPEIQILVDQAKSQIALSSSGLAEREALMVAKIVTTSKEKGRLTYYPSSITTCPCCGRNDGYWPVKRSGRYKRRGEPDHDHPKVFTGYDLDRGFVTMQRYIFVGFCDSCASRVKPALANLLCDVRAAIPSQITGEPSKFVRWDNRECSECGWKGHEGQLGQLRTLMGDGWYRGQCPNCSAKNEFLSNKIKSIDGYTLVEATA